ncbi:MAG TPA: hypothetical protein VMW93_08065 [bacterium]|nr:hypothetical protein [bacterium]
MKWAAIWLSFLTLLYVINLVGDFIQARRVRALEERIKKLEDAAG